MTTERDRAHAHWSRLHDGLDPASSAWISGWVRLSHACASPLARRGVPADVVTLAGVLVTALVPLVASLGAAWPLAATGVLVVGAVLDGVDGAVAAQTGTDSRWGRVLDSLADRVSDLLLLGAVAVVGAPWPLAVAVAALTLLHESVRATAQAAGVRGPGAVTVWERPSRVIVGAFGTGLVGLEWLAREAGVDVLADVDGELLAACVLAVGLALAVVGLLHLLVAVRRQLRGAPGQAGPTSPATMREDSTTSGSPPPGWDDPPTR